MPGPPVPALLVVVSRLWVPVRAAAVELSGVLAPLKNTGNEPVPGDAAKGGLRGSKHRVSPS